MQLERKGDSMEIKATGTINYNSIKALTHLGLFQKANPKKRMILWAVLYGALFALIVLEMIVFEPVPLLFVLAGCLLLFYLFMSYLYFLAPKKRYNAMAKMKDAVNEYVFQDNVMQVATKSESYNGEAEIQYAVIVKVMETSAYFFLFQTNSQVLLVEKSSVTGGTAEDIRNKFMPLIGDKYIICKY